MALRQKAQVGMENLVETVFGPIEESPETTKWTARMIQIRALSSEIMEDESLEESTFEILEVMNRILAMMARKRNETQIEF